MKTWWVVCAAVFGCVAWSALSISAEKTSPDEAAIRKKIDSYAAAFERKDAAAVAAHWAPEAVYQNPVTGARVVGRKAIEEHFQGVFANLDKVRLIVKVNSIHFVTPDVAMEDGTASVLIPGESVEESSYTAVHVRKDKDWLLDSVRETVLPAPPTASEHLEQLAWLVGEWEDADDQSTITTRCNWTAGNAFLTRSFDVEIGGQVLMQGTQIIGWDPLAKQIRSWTFDSEGGVTEGRWEQNDDAWIIHSKCTLADGRLGTQLNVLKQLDDDSFSWKSSARQVDGELLPNVDEVVVVRKSVSTEEGE